MTKAEGGGFRTAPQVMDSLMDTETWLALPLSVNLPYLPGRSFSI
jgi:hypothetical protein